MNITTYHYFYLLDESGQPIPTDDQRAACNLLCDHKKRTVGRTHFRFRGLDIEVSTVFLVYNHQYREGLPILWETMTFSRSSRFGGQQWRYTSQAEAEAGHSAMVAWVRGEFKRKPRHRV